MGQPWELLPPAQEEALQAWPIEAAGRSNNAAVCSVAKTFGFPSFPSPVPPLWIGQMTGSSSLFTCHLTGEDLSWPLCLVILQVNLGQMLGGW